MEATYLEENLANRQIQRTESREPPAGMGTDMTPPEQEHESSGKATEEKNNWLIEQPLSLASEGEIP